LSTQEFPKISVPGAILDAGTAFVLWISIPIEIRIERAGSRKIYIKARKIRWAIQQNVETEGSAVEFQLNVDREVILDA